MVQSLCRFVLSIIMYLHELTCRCDFLCARRFYSVGLLNKNYLMSLRPPLGNDFPVKLKAADGFCLFIPMCADSCHCNVGNFAGDDHSPAVYISQNQYIVICCSKNVMVALKR